ncbi:MAG TPA: LLM class flavin-dependent oxidoreductase [Streptosporangiaceae bacterium]
MAPPAFAGGLFLGGHMDVGIGLPSTIPGVRGEAVIEWARRADTAGFSTLGTLDRVVYDNFDAVPTLAAAAAVTSRIRLTTAILIAPYRGNGVLLGKQLASIDALSGGRLTVGIAVGGREDDFTATGSSFRTRGADMDALLAEMRSVWAAEPHGDGRPVGPAPVQAGGPPLLIGGNGKAAIRRTVEYGAGWIAGGGGPDMFAQGAETIRAAWTDAGRPGAPRLAALSYFALGAGATDAAHRYLTDYYSFLGDFADQIAKGALTTPDAVRDAVRAFGDAGCDELVLFPCSADPDQVSLLAAALNG